MMNSVKQRKSGWLRFVLMMIGLLFSAYYGWGFFANADRYPVKQVKISGTYQHLDQSSLHALIEPYVLKGFFNMSTYALQKKLLQQAWIVDVSVRRSWPDTINIKIVEQQPVARWGNDKLLNTQGDLFVPALESFPPNLPVLLGAEDQQSLLWQHYQQFNHLLKPLGLSVHLLEMNSRQALHIVLNNGIEVHVGRSDPLVCLQRLVIALPKITGDKIDQVKYIDLRYNNGLAIAWKSDQ